MYKALNNSENVDTAREQGLWPDQTTQENRYSGFVEGVVELAENGYFDPSEPLQVLDVGSSTGAATHGFEAAITEYTDLEVETVSYDMHRDALRYNRALDNSDGHVQGDARQLPFADDTFDMVLTKTLISRLDGKHQTEALQEINRVLDEDGAAAIEVDPEGREGMDTGDEYVVTTGQLDSAATASDDFSAYPIDLEPGTQDRKPRVDETPEPTEPSDQYGDLDDGSEIVAVTEPGGQLGNDYDGSEIVTETEPHEQFSTDDGAVVV